MKMNYLSVPIIAGCCYIIGEIYKVIFKNKKEWYKIIPILVALCGGVMGVVMYITEPKMIFDVENMWIALEIGIMSGTCSTGSNQIVKQIKKKGE